MGVAAGRLLDPEVPSGLGHGDRHVPVQVVGSADRDHVEVVTGQQVAPVGVQLGEPVRFDGPRHLLAQVAVANRHQGGPQRQLRVVR